MLNIYFRSLPHYLLSTCKLFRSDIKLSLWYPHYIISLPITLYHSFCKKKNYNMHQHSLYCIMHPIPSIIPLSSIIYHYHASSSCSIFPIYRLEYNIRWRCMIMINVISPCLHAVHHTILSNPFVCDARLLHYTSSITRRIASQLPWISPCVYQKETSDNIQFDKSCVYIYIKYICMYYSVYI